MANTLFLRLEGPMQSWGERARWTVRDTSDEPTKSGIVGMLACALGLREDTDLRELSRQIDIGVRCDKPGTRLVDYHTVSGGVMSAEGKVKRNATTHEPETVVSRRSYLCDAAFTVAVRADSELIQRLGDAIQSPHWVIYLGRKSCVPSVQVFDGVGDYASVQDALEQHWSTPPATVDESRQEVVETLRGVITSDASDGVRRRDEIDSRSRRTYLWRYTKDIPLIKKTQETR